MGCFVNTIGDIHWWAREGSNLRQAVYKTAALPLSYEPA